MGSGTDPSQSSWLHNKAAFRPQQLFGALGAPTIVQRAQGTKAQRSGGKAQAGGEQAPGVGDLMTQNLMTLCLRGGELPLEEQEGGPATSCLLQDSLPRQGQLPHRVQA